jgi:hypothetical protein
VEPRKEEEEIIFTSLDKILRTEWQQAFPEFHLLGPTTTLKKDHFFSLSAS